MNPIEISPEEFRELVSQVSEIATEYLQQLDGRAIVPDGSGDEVNRILATHLPEKGLRAEAILGLRDVVRHSRAQNGRFFGYILGSGEPVAAAADLLASVLNQNVTAWRSGPASAALERTVVGWLAQAIGCGNFTGTLTGGGSAANLMALAMAREALVPANEKGLRASQPCRAYVSTEAHMSIGKAVALLGIGRANVCAVATDEKFRMIPEELDRAMQRDKQEGILPLTVVASAGTTSTGAIDPLADIVEITRKYGAWLHVDGAYGALAAIAVPEKFAGLEFADSISLDPHKWLYQPLDCGCLLYRHASSARKAFSGSAAYVRSLSAEPIEGFSFFDETMELSRRSRALKLWLSLRYHGLENFRLSIQKDLAQARRLRSAIEVQPQLQLMAPVELSAVCFRYVGAGILADEETNRLNLEMLQQVIRRGRVYLSNASLHGKFCLRACVVNHRTTDADIDCVVPEVLAAAQQVRGRG